MEQILTVLGIVAGSLTALGVVVKLGLLPAYRFVRKIEMAHDLILEFPTWQEDVDRSLSQLNSNGGSSLKDVVLTTKTDVAQLKQLVQTHITDFETHIKDTEAHRINPS